MGVPSHWRPDRIWAELQFGQEIHGAAGLAGGGFFGNEKGHLLPAGNLSDELRDVPLCPLHQLLD